MIIPATKNIYPNRLEHAATNVLYPQVKICYKVNAAILLHTFNTQLVCILFLMYLNSYKDLVIHCLRLILQDFDGIHFHIFVLEIFDARLRIVGNIVCMRK